MKVMLRYTLTFALYFFLSIPAFAIEFDVQIEKIKWRYQEYAQGKFVTTLLPTSKTDGDAGLLKLQLSNERNQQWFYAVSGAIMDSTSQTKEEWGVVQTNDLKIKQQDMRFDFQYRMLDARFGLWLSKRKQTQTRQNYAGTAAATLLGKTTVEVISSEWMGLSFTGRGGREEQLELRLDAAIPLSIEVDNSLSVTQFTKKDGYRLGFHWRWTLPKQEVGVEGLNLTLRYEYQELGGEVSAANEFWPYNRWQMLAFGALYAW